MFVIVHAQKLVLPSVLVLALVLSYRAFQYRHLLYPMLAWFSAGTTLLLIGVSSTLLTKRYPWAHLVLDGTLYVGLLLIYWAIRHVLSGTSPPWPLVRSPSFIAVVFITALAMGLDAMRILGRPHFAPSPALPTLNYPRVFPANGLSIEWGAVIGYYFLHNLVQLIFVISIIVTYARTMRRHTDLTYVARRLLCLLGFLIATFGMASVTIGIVAWTLRHTAAHATSVRVYQITKISGLIVIAFGFLVPHGWLTWIIRPASHLVARRQRQHDLLIAYLHGKMVQIAAGVQLATPDDRLRATRLPIEISDARQVIWSQTARAEPITPKVEAEHLDRLLRAGMVIISPGPHVPPPTRDRNVKRHNLATARQLRRLARHGTDDYIPSDRKRYRGRSMRDTEATQRSVDKARVDPS
jgi:hypothetical protein